MTAGVITMRFTTKWPCNPTSLAIAWLAGSRRWPHVINIIDGTAYEATMLHGCRAVPVAEAMVGVAAYRDMYVWVPDIEEAIKFGEGQKGKGYDFAALALPILASDDWADWNRWWCSELCFMQALIGGTAMLDPDEHSRVTPNDLHQCNYPKSDITKLK